MKINLNMPAMKPNCEYSGDNFSMALKRAEKCGGRLFENDEHRGEFLVLTIAQEIEMWPFGRPATWRLL